jgi:dihydroorotate dehydrogenase
VVDLSLERQTKKEVITMYKYFQKLLFCFPPETAHRISLFCLKKIPAACFPKVPDRSVEAMGLKFKNPIGLAAGFDSNGDYLVALSKLGFGFIEVGGVTPKPQIGNPKPRIFRLPKKNALINRMGFCNKGVEYLVERLKKLKYDGIIGVNIAKNMSTPLEEASKDYIVCMEKLYPYVDYITINISSPNTPNLRQLQQGEFLNDLLSQISSARDRLEKEYTIRKPLVLKISPDETPETLENMVKAVCKNNIDGIIATNTSVDRMTVADCAHAKEAGGLSGAPIFERSTHVLKTVHELIQTNSPKANITLIGLGGIMGPEDVQAKFDAGAKLVQVYTGFIYKGPLLISRLIN